MRNCMRFLSRAICLAALLLIWPASFQAYIGPGAGFVFVSSFLALFFALFLAGVYLLFWPIRFLIQAVMGRRSRGSKNARVKRMVIIGLDGFDPRLASQFMEAGKLPNLHRLKEGRCVCPIGHQLSFYFAGGLVLVCNGRRCVLPQYFRLPHARSLHLCANAVFGGHSKGLASLVSRPVPVPALKTTVEAEAEESGILECARFERRLQLGSPCAHHFSAGEVWRCSSVGNVYT